MDILDDPRAEVLVRAPLPEGGYREVWVSLAVLDARARHIADTAIADALALRLKLEAEYRAQHTAQDSEPRA